jgi:hypothetical protein
MPNLTKADLVSMFKGLVIALIGAGLTYLTGWVTGHDFGSWTPLIVTVWSTVVNTLRKYFDAPIKDAIGLKI